MIQFLEKDSLKNCPVWPESLYLKNSIIYVIFRKLVCLCNKPRQHIKKKRHHFTKKHPYSQSYGFSSSHVWMWEVDHEEGWVLNNWCFWIVVLEKTLESLLDSKEIKAVNPKGNQPWIFIGRTDAEAPILWLADAKPDVKTLMLGKIEGKREKKGATKDEMVL